MEILLATTNPAKITALAERVGPNVTIRSLPAELHAHSTPEHLEVGRSSAKIARAKAVYWSRHIPDSFVAASDGGLLIPSLGNSWNPLQTSRFPGPDATNADRRDRLLHLAQNLVGKAREIGWTEAIAIAQNGKVLIVFRASSPNGLLSSESPIELEADGFWAPKIWCCPEFGGRRLSDISEVDRLSRTDHWAILGEQLTEWARNQEPAV